jgi:hypothetical protein
MGSNSHDALGSRQLQGSWSRKGPLLTNRMSELLTYGSVGGAGRKPGPYPAVDGGIALRLQIKRTWPRRH